MHIKKVIHTFLLLAVFQRKKSDAMEYAKMYNLLPNKVEEIEQKKKEKFEKEMIMTEYEERWIQSMLS